MLNPQDYNRILSPRHRLFDLHLREAFRQRSLILLFVKRDFIASYKQTVFGPLWFFLNPILTTLIFTVIFGELAGLPTLDAVGDAVIPGFLFYMAGNICWGLFAGILSATANSFRGNADLMSKVYFPRIIAPISYAISNLITYGMQFAMFVVLYAFCFFFGRGDMHITWLALLLPLNTIQIMIFGIGCGIIISSITTKYRDLNMMLNILVRFWQYATPVMYGLTLVSGHSPQLMQLYMLNPMTLMVTSFRYFVFGFGYFDMAYYLISWGLSLLILFIGLVMFSRIEQTFVDTI